jgi:predicted ATPase
MVSPTPEAGPIRTPDQRLRVFVSSTLRELAPERGAVREAVERLRLAPVMFELGARPHPPRDLYRSYLAQSHVFVGVYWQSYGWVAPEEEVSGLEDEYRLSGSLPKLIYVKSPAPEREGRLKEMLSRIRDDDRASYKYFSTPEELKRLVENDLSLLLSERFEATLPRGGVSEKASGAGILPVPPTPLVGREREAEEVADLVLEGGTRLVTLTGPGGVGKSRLALEVASRLAPDFEGGARFVELAPVTDPERVAATISRALGLRESGNRPPAEDLKTYLRDRRLLLVLDNFEQVTEAAPLLADLLAAAPGVEALVTSRTALRLSGERGFAVPPLSLPEDGLGVGDAHRYGAVRLFVERARAVAPGFELTEENAPAVAEICHRLDGLPLAIELAAARVRLLPPNALLARLGSRLGLLTGGARDLPERQRTLRNTMAWSHGLLGEGEKDLFARLGVFTGGFDLEAAEAVFGPGGGFPEDPAGSADVLEVLGSLVDGSLVRQEESDGEPRFSMLETIKEYALERLRESPHWREAHDRHAEHYLSFALTAEPQLRGPGQLGWLGRLEREADNLRAALSRLLATDRVESAGELAWALWLFWWFHGHVEEGGRWMEEVLSRSAGLAPLPRAWALAGAGAMAFARGDYPRAEDLFGRSLVLFRKEDHKPGIARALIVPGQRATFAGDLARGRELLGESLSLYRELGDDWNAALLLNFLGQADLVAGDVDAAATSFAEGLRVSRLVGDRLPIRVSLFNLALTRQASGDPAGATSLLEEGLTLSAEAGDHASAAYFLEALAGLVDDPARAGRLFGAAEALLDAQGGAPVYAYAPDRSRRDAAVAAARSRTDAATFEEAWAEGRRMGLRRSVEYALADHQTFVKQAADKDAGSVR